MIERGTWTITEMEMWNEAYLNAEVQAFITFGPDETGSFQFGYVQGELDYRITQREGRAAVEFTWDGHDEMEPAMGRGWAVLGEDGLLRGRFFFHLGDDSSFIAQRS